MFQLAEALHKSVQEVESWPAHLLDEWAAYFAIMRPPPQKNDER